MVDAPGDGAFLPEFAEAEVGEPIGEGGGVEAVELGSAVDLIDGDDLFGFKFAEEGRRLGAHDDLGAGGGGADQAAEHSQSFGMEAELGFVEDDHGGGVGLHEGGGEAEEADGSVGHMAG